MEIDPKHLQIALSLAHLQGVAHGHALAQQKQGPKQNQQKARRPVNQPKPPNAQMVKPKQSPKAQGPKGKAQGRHGAKGPLGGSKARQNDAGTLSHQDPLKAARKAYGG